MFSRLMLKTRWGVQRALKNSEGRDVMENDGYAYVKFNEKGGFLFPENSNYDTVRRVIFHSGNKPQRLKRIFTWMFLRNPELKYSSKVDYIPFYVDGLRIARDGKVVFIDLDNVFFNKYQQSYVKTKFTLLPHVGIDWISSGVDHKTFESIVDTNRNPDDRLVFFGDFHTIDFVTFYGSRVDHKNVVFNSLDMISTEKTKKVLYKGLTHVENSDRVAKI